MAKRSTPLSSFFSSIVSYCHYWATVLHGLTVLNIECDAQPLVVQVQERTVCISAVNGLPCLANCWRSASELFGFTVSADRVLWACPFLLMRVACWLAHGFLLGPFYIRVLTISLCTTVDIMLSSFACVAILVLIDDFQGPPSEPPRPVNNFSEQWLCRESLRSSYAAFLFFRDIFTTFTQQRDHPGSASMGFQ